MIESLCFDDAISYIKSLDIYGSVLGLQNMRALAEEVDNPQNRLRFIHVTGTNGKGSTCAFLSSILMNAGYKTGSYNSPAVLSDTDQFRINMEIISEDLFSKAVSIVKEACEKIVARGGVQPTRFEVETMTAFVAFDMEGCDLVVLETGLGGTDDATNIIESALVHVITSISLDHCLILGKTTAEIARNKAGIIKDSAPTVVYRNITDPSSYEEIKIKCDRMGSMLNEVTDSFVSNISIDSGKLHFDIDSLGYRNLAISMPGAYQPVNASMAVLTACLLKNMGYTISDDDIRAGLRKAKIPFRFEIIKKSREKNKTVDIILDGAHNPDGARQLVNSLELVYPGRKFVFITGIFKDKEYKEMVRITAEKADRIYTVMNTYSNRSLDAETLRNEFACYNENVFAVSNIEEAVKCALSDAEIIVDSDSREAVIVCFGSLSWLRYARKILESK